MSDVEAVLGRVLDELRPATVERRAAGRATVTVDGRCLEIRVTRRGRMLLHITETTFAVAGPPCEYDVRIVVRQRGLVRRHGLAAVVHRGGATADDLAARLEQNPGLASAARTLDFTTFEIGTREGRLEAAVTLMGAGMTRLRVPPTASYVRLHDDQRTALFATVDAISELWALPV